MVSGGGFLSVGSVVLNYSIQPINNPQNVVLMRVNVAKCPLKRVGFCDYFTVFVV